jgi:hypothetical protein
MGVNLSERQAQCSANHPATIRQLIQVVLLIEKTSKTRVSLCAWDSKSDIGGEAEMRALPLYIYVVDFGWNSASLHLIKHVS